MATIDSQYIYSLGRVKELEKGLLSASHLDRILESDEPFSVLRSLVFFKAAEEHSDADSPAEVFRRERLHNRTVLHELVADSPLEDLFLLPYDIHNIKILLKGKLAGNSEVKTWPLEEGLYPQNMLIEAIYDELPTDLPSPILDDIRELAEHFHDNRQFARIDYRLDRRLRTLQIAIAQKANSTFLVDYLRRLSDVQNIATTIRYKSHELDHDGLTDALLDTGTLDYAFFEKIYSSGWESLGTTFKPTDYGKLVADALAHIDHPGFLAILDTCGSSYLIEYLRLVRQQCFGIEPVLAFYLARDHEIKVVRTLVMGKTFEYASEKLTLRTKTLF